MHKTVSKGEWLKARKQLLLREKKFSHDRDELSQARRDLPWVKIEANYVFEGSDRRFTLAELFGDRSQLIVYHFMLSPEMTSGCPGCSFLIDNLPTDRSHLAQKDLKFVVISRAPIAKIDDYKKRMGWKFDWLSSSDSTFNYDFDVTYTPQMINRGEPIYNYGTEKVTGQEQPGLSVFFKDGTSGQIFHTYSTFSRGLDEFLPTYHYLDVTPKGRDESGAMSWVKRHDEY